MCAARPEGSVDSNDSMALQYASYRNNRYGLAVAYPPKLFTRAEPVGEDEGRKFLSSENSAWFYASAGLNPADWTAKDIMQLSTVYYRQNGARLTYSRISDRWYVLSGTRDGSIFYEKGVLSRDGAISRTLLIEYPLACKPFFDAIVTRMSHSFQ